MDETLEISRNKLFNILSRAFTDITEEALSLMKTNNTEVFVKNIELLIDNLNHDILEKSKREDKKIIKEKDRIEVDWS